MIDADPIERRFVEHTLQIAIQAALDVASHVISSERFGEPNTNRELFEILARHGWLDEQLGETLRHMAGFRNILVHGYTDVDARIVQDVVERHLEIYWRSQPRFARGSPLAEIGLDIRDVGEFGVSPSNPGWLPARPEPPGRWVCQRPASLR